MRKTRSDAKLLNLPEEQQSQLAEWLINGTPYHAAIALCEREFGVRTSAGALSSFWQEVCVPALLRRRSQAATTAETLAEQAAQRPGMFDPATIDAIRQRAFDLAINPASKPDDVAALFSLLLKARDQDLKGRAVTVAERRLEMLEQQAAAVRNAVNEARTGGLTPESLRKIEEAAKLL